MNLKTAVTKSLSLLLLTTSLISCGQKSNEQDNQVFKDNSENYSQNFNQMMSSYIYKLNEVEVDDRCAKFMNSKLVFGDLGLFIFNELKTNGLTKYPELMEASSLKRMCPKYKAMNTTERSQVITILLATMAHFESSCNVNSINRNGPNGHAIGLYQLHQNKEDIYDGKARYCLRNSGYNSKNSSICALSMLNLQIKNRQGEIFSAKSYWDVLRPEGHAGKAPAMIKKAVSKFKLCQ